MPDLFGSLRENTTFVLPRIKAVLSLVSPKRSGFFYVLKTIVNPPIITFNS